MELENAKNGGGRQGQNAQKSKSATPVRFSILEGSEGGPGWERPSKNEKRPAGSFFVFGDFRGGSDGQKRRREDLPRELRGAPGSTARDNRRSTNGRDSPGFAADYEFREHAAKVLDSLTRARARCQMCRENEKRPAGSFFDFGGLGVPPRGCPKAKSEKRRARRFSLFAFGGGGGWVVWTD